MTVGERIRKYRIEKGWTQKKLGEESNIAEPTIRRYELGKLNPKYETLQKISKALNVPLANLLLGEPDPVDTISDLLPIEFNGFERFIESQGYRITFDGDQYYIVHKTKRKAITPEDLKRLARTSSITVSALLDDFMSSGEE